MFDNPPGATSLTKYFYSCEVRAFVSSPQAPAHEKVLDVVEEYFRSGSGDLEGRICKTWLPPLYFQYPGK
jgi:hypothetical protein